MIEYHSTISYDHMISYDNMIIYDNMISMLVWLDDSMKENLFLSNHIIIKNKIMIQNYIHEIRYKYGTWFIIKLYWKPRNLIRNKKIIIAGFDNKFSNKY